jgi:hypothetical protein
MADHVSPGVYTKIIDLSTYLQDIPGTIGFISFLSRKGPDNQIKFISSQTQQAEVYGKPNLYDYGRAWGQGPYIAWNNVTVSPAVYEIRCLPDDAAYSNLFMSYNSDSTGSIVITHETSQNTVAELETSMQSSAPIYPMVAFYPIGRGDYYDDYAITIARNPNRYARSSVDGQEATPVEALYTLNIWLTQSDGQDVIVESFDVSFDSEAVDDFGESIFIEDVINRYSKDIRVIVSLDNINEWKRNGNVEVTIGTSVTPVHLFHGSEGSLVTVDPDTGKRTVDDSVAEQLLITAYQGLLVNPTNGKYVDQVLDLDEYYFPIVWDAGYSDNVKNQIVTFVQTQRMDGVVILDNGDNLSVDESLTARSTTHDWNTYYASIFEPYSKVYDVFTGKDIWVTPVYHMASMIPLNDKLYNIWFPSAGFNRGTVSNIKELRFSPVLSDRDRLYLAQINPIVKFSIGETVWGNLTTQRRPSALQNLSTIRTVLYIKRALENFLKFYIFEFNDESTWNEMNNAILPFLESIKQQRGLESYSIEIGATEYEKKRKIAHVNVTLVPIGIIERIELNLFIK